MKNLKILGLTAIAAAALMAFAGTASATTLTSPQGTTVASGTLFHAVSEGKLKFRATYGTIECESTMEGALGSSPAERVENTVSSLTWSNCGSNCEDKTLKTGTLSISGNGNGTGALAGSGQEVTTNCLGFHCIWSTGGGTSLGTLTGSGTTGATATVDLSATLSRTGGTSGSFCGSTYAWSGSYSFTAPNPLYID